jgi:tetratricopeptide (TPR) repeat protein
MSAGWIFPLVLVAAIFAAYQPAWHAGFIWGDESRRLWLFGSNATGYHLLNLGVHAANSILLWLILRRLRVPGAELAAGLFALHPVMVESVAWISGFRGLLVAFSCFLVVTAYLRFDPDRRWHWYAIALGFFGSALLAQTSVATLPGALLLVFWWQRGRLTWKRDWIPLLPFFALGVLKVVSVASGGPKMGEDLGFPYTFVERGLIAGRALWFYLEKIIFPANLLFIYPRWFVRQDQAWQYLYPLGVLTGLLVLWLSRHSRRGLLAATLFFIATLFPALGFFNLPEFAFSFVADHRVYLASAGVLVVWAAGAVELKRRLGDTFMRGLGVAVLAGLGILTWQQSRQYRDAETLYRLTLKKNPDAWMAEGQLGALLVKSGRYEEALPHLIEARDSQPQNVEVMYNLGVALGQLHRIDEALSMFEEVVRTRPDDAAVQYNLGTALLQEGRTWESVSHFNKALQLDPNLQAARVGLEIAQRELARPPGK